MNTETFSEWLRRQGFHIIRTASSYWYNQGPRVYQAFPYHWCIQPTEEELREFLIQEKAVALRYSTRFEATEGKISYRLKRCRVERLSMAKLANEGWRLQKDTLRRQRRIGSMSQNEWRQLCLAAEGLSGSVWH